MMLENEVPKYRKKSKGTDKTKSNHKHVYETVLLQTRYTFNLGTTRTHIHEAPTRVCTICGRVDYVDNSPEYYINKQVPDMPFKVTQKVLSEKALKLPRWVYDTHDKVATRVVDND